MINYLKRIDLFAVNYNFESNGSQKHQTIEGACISFLAVTIIIVISFIFGKDVYERKKVKIMNGKELIEESIIEMKNFPFSITYANTEPIESILEPLENVFDIFVELIIIDPFYKITYEPVTMDDCKNQLSYFEGKSGDVFKRLIASTNRKNLCFNFKEFEPKLFVKNGRRLQNSNSITVRVVPCHSRLDPDSRKNCKYTKETFGEYIYVGFTYYESFVENQDFANPIKYIDNTIGYPVNLSASLYYTLNISKDILFTDTGFLLENSSNIIYNNVASIENKVQINSNEVLQVMLSSTNIRNKTSRSFMKLQELLANIGGFSNFIIILLNLFLSNYFKFKYRAFVHLNSFYKILHDNKDLKLKLKSSLLFVEKNNLKFDHIMESNQDLDVVPNENYISKCKIQDNESPSINLHLSLKNFIDFNLIFKKNTKLQNIKKEIFKNLYGDLDEFDMNNKNQDLNLNYFDYLIYGVFSIFKCCKNQEKNAYYKNEMIRIDQLLDFSTFIQFLAEQYSIHFYD